MEKTERIGTLPVNSQIFVNYETDPPEITFGYPDPDTSIVKRSDVTVGISVLFTMFLLVVFGVIYVLNIQSMYYPDMGPGDTKINQIEILDFEKFQYFNGTRYNETHYGFDKLNINYTWNNKQYSTELGITHEGYFYFVPYFYEIKSNRFWILLCQVGVLAVLFIILLMLNSYWIARIFKDTKWGHKNYPLLNKKLYDAKFSAEFLPKDFPANNIIEIPLFKNMYVDYDATGDFAENLKKISIIEHPFNRLIKKGGMFRKKTIAKKVNVYLWKCVFEFKDKCEKGKLELRWT
jgi:hypothetical protein